MLKIFSTLNNVYILQISKEPENIGNGSISFSGEAYLSNVPEEGTSSKRDWCVWTSLNFRKKKNP